MPSPYRLTPAIRFRLQLKKTEPLVPVATPSPTGCLARYAVRWSALAYFLHLAAATVEVGGAPLLGSQVCTTMEERWYLAELRAAGLVTTDEGEIICTRAGIKLATAAGVDMAGLEGVPW